MSCPEPPALCGPPEDETGEVVLESETEGECRTKREPLAAAPEVLAPVCDSDEMLAIDEDKRGLPAAVTARERLPLPTCPVGEASELVEEVEDCRLVT